MSIPSFVQLGTAVVYTELAGDVVFDRHSDQSALDTLIVLSISPTTVTVREVFQQRATTVVSDRTFVPGAPAGYGYQFWVDPADPTGSISGPFDSPLILSGTTSVNGVNATVLNFPSNNGAGYDTGAIQFQTSTGLVLK